MRWQPLAIGAAAVASVLVILQAMTQGPAVAPPRAMPGVASGPSAAGGPPGGASPMGARPAPGQPGAQSEEERKEQALLSEGTFSHPVSAAAPPLRAERSDGRVVELRPKKGEVWLVNFWATWCPPCVQELPSILALGGELSAKYPGRFRMLAVSGDDSWEAVHRFFARMPGGAPAYFEQLRDPDGKAAESWYCTARGYCPDLKFPETYVVDATGRIRAMMVGARDWKDPQARELIEGLLRKPVTKR